MFQGKHAKGRAFFKHPPLSGEQHAQAGGRDPVDLDVYVLGPAPHQLVAHIAADKISAATLGGHSLRQTARDLHFLHISSKTVQSL